MKRIFLITAAALTALSIAGCQDNTTSGANSSGTTSTSTVESSTSGTTSTSTVESSTSGTTSTSTVETSSGGTTTSTSEKSSSSTASKSTVETSSGSEKPQPKPKYENSLDVLEKIWNSYKEEDKFSVVGIGGGSAATDGAPAAFDLSAADDMKRFLLLPTEHVSKLKSAASLIHMLNSNTFTSGVFQTEENPNDLSKALVDAANSTAFMCGAPQVIVTLKTDDFVIMAFGTEDLVNRFKEYALGIDGISLIYEGAIEYASGGNGGGGIAIPVL